MMGRILSAGVIIFWVTMMTALVRTERLGLAGRGAPVPTDLVLAKVFAQTEPARLNVYYEKQPVGFCKLEVEPERSLQPAGYRARLELTVALASWGMASRLRVVGGCVFDSRYDIQRFNFNGAFGENRMNVRGDTATRKVMLDILTPAGYEERVLSLDQLRGGGLAGTLGMPGMPPLGLTGGTTGQVTTATAWLGKLTVAGASLKTYVVEAKPDPAVRLTIWISEQGEVLKVDTSLGVTMVADVLSGTSQGAIKERPDKEP